MMFTVIFLNGIVLNSVAAILLLLAWKHPRLTKLIFSILFGASAIANMILVIAGTEKLAGNGQQAITWFNDILINGQVNWILASLIIIQLLISVAMVLRGWIYITGVIAAIILLGTIIPLGTSAAFPATFIMALALTRLLRFNHHYFWYVPRRIWS